jgi:hypothetical protein
MRTVIGLGLLVLFGLIAAVFLLVMDIFGLVPGGLTVTAVVVLLVLRYVVMPVLFVVLAGALVFTVFKLYQSLSDGERATVHGVVCPAIDTGLYEAHKRTDTWGKVAGWIRRYRRVARKYPRQ